VRYTNIDIRNLQEIKPILQKEYAVNKIGLFGSFADKTNTSDSDVDIITNYLPINKLEIEKILDNIKT